MPRSVGEKGDLLMLKSLFALMFVVCQAHPVGEPDINGFQNREWDMSSCKEVVAEPDFIIGDLSRPQRCARAAMRYAPDWENEHPGWYVRKSYCPHPDGTLPHDPRSGI